ncbi:hypothetical protein FISHEDRAFT_76402 [Fistulina hepatica ATCC 64428]|uniref:Xylanolytic transcriptional activator regulatory domain-containing protein n=1 Tax=Fistulina hepatica ATCC 64428 TaxID=1128425 RepID=A0A0D7A6K4_9AGAR|nr:hypothetical protein FISHEDRAFT_76402 [Fistulina hepatica ATCC 64428]
MDIAKPSVDPPPAPVSPAEKPVKERKRRGRVGCAAICPDGYLTSGRPGNRRLLLSSKEELEEQIGRLNTRVVELEAALNECRSDSSPPQDARDGLLPSSLSSLESSHANPGRNSGSSVELRDSDEDNLVDSFGTLSVRQDGSFKFLGCTARSEYLLRIRKHPSEGSARLRASIFQGRLLVDSPYDFPSAEPDSDLAQQVVAMIPPVSEAIETLRSYLEYGKYIYRAISPEEMYDEVLALVYKRDGGLGSYYYQALGLFYSALALGAMFARTRKPDAMPPCDYYLAARAALSIHSPDKSSTSLWAIHAVIHLAEFLELNEEGTSGSTQSWELVGLAVRLSHSIGLHLNSLRWNLPPQKVQRRNRLFWDLFTLDTWTSFNFGRPTAISLNYMDCDLPYNEEVVNANGVAEMHFRTWKYKFAKLVHQVMSIAFGAKPPPYAVILRLDRQVRDFPVPEYLQTATATSPSDTASKFEGERWMVLSAMETVLLNLHRAYFAVALDQSPEALPTHRYVPSVLAAYRSAWRLSRGFQLVWDTMPENLQRLNLPWSRVLSAAIVLCLFVTRAPAAKMSRAALAELDRLSNLFAQATPSSKTASSFRESIASLTQKAHAAFDRTQAPQDASSLTPDELDRLGGRTRLVAQEAPPVEDRFPYEYILNDTVGQDVQAAGDVHMNDVHPTIVADLQFFGPPGVSYDVDASPVISQTQCNSCGSAGSTFQPFPSLSTDGTQRHQDEFGGMSMAPVLDATWHNFVGQLGF